MTETFQFRRNSGGNLLIACGALAREVIQLVEHNGLGDLDVQCLPAQLHHRPALIPGALEKVLISVDGKYSRVFVAYGDCGTAGGIDKVLEKYGAERIAGPHCFSFFEGNDRFENNSEDVTSFFLTDFFCRHFDKFMWQQFGLDRHPTMVDFVFGNYKKVVYVAQTKNKALERKAAEIAERLGLDYEYRYRGYGDLAVFVKNTAAQQSRNEAL